MPQRAAEIKEKGPATAALARQDGRHEHATMTKKRYYAGPISDHYDGTRFFNPDGPRDKSAGDLVRFLTGTRFAAWPRNIVDPKAEAPPARVGGTALRVTSIGHASHLIQTADLNILVDPVWSDRASPFAFAGPKRARAPGLVLDQLPPIDIVLVTHNHYDHMDLATLSAVARRHACRIIVPLGNDTILRRHDTTLQVEAYDWGDRVALSETMSATLAPCRHWSSRWIGDRRMALWAAFVIETASGTIYHIGDTAYGDGAIFRDVRARFGTPRLAILPIGAYAPRWFMRDQHVDPDESVRIFADCGAHHALGHHWGTFRLTAEPIDEPPRRLAQALAAAGIEASRFRVQRPGEAFDVPEV